MSQATRSQQEARPDDARGAARRPAVELVGPWLQNNGDGLNLWSVLEHYAETARVGVSSMLGGDGLPPDAALAWVKWPTGTRQLAGHLLRRDAGEVLRALKHRVGLAVLSEASLAQRGLMDGRAMAGLLDCSGFAYGDVWSLPRVDRRIQQYQRVKDHGGRLVMLPQAFGPFTKPEVRDRVGRLLGMCDLIFARDPVSLEHLHTLEGPAGRCELAPDITHLLEGRPPWDRGDGEAAAAWRQRVLIVPNARMLDRTESDVARGYEALVGRAVDATRRAGLEPWLMVHEANDRPLADRLARSLGSAGGGEPLTVVQEDARTSKAMIAASFAVIGSRYHSLISALSSGVPAVGTSWHHKYEALFADYGQEEFLLSPADPEELQTRVLDRLLDGAARESAAQRIAERAAAQKQRVVEAWAKVDACLGVGAG